MFRRSKESPHDLTPVLIIPGFMSSGLEIQRSEFQKTWEGKRIWLNLRSLGFESMGLKTRRTVEYKQSPAQQQTDEEQGSSYKTIEDEAYQRQLHCVNQWVQHMSLAGDMCTEHDGIEIRAISGLLGVDYLTPGALTNHVSYVFGPVINALKAAGYTDDNLDAAPYDWRLSPTTMESRDGYFTQTMRKIEDMYTRNNNTPVVLLCHSLGCKTGHYFLNFASSRGGGSQWLDKYIHTYLIVGAPSIGAPKSLRATIDGDKMGLDAFLSDEEGLAMGRSLGSGPWLMPAVLPPHNAPANAFLRREGVLTITLLPVDVSGLYPETAVPKLRVEVTYEKETLATQFKEPVYGNRSGAIIGISERFIFTTPSSLSCLGNLKIILYEPGLGFSRQLSKTGPYYKWYLWPLRTAVRLAMCPIKYCCCCICLLAYRILRKLFHTASAGTDATAGAMGSFAVLASSSKIQISKILSTAAAVTHQNEAEFVVNLSHVNNDRGGWFRTLFRKPTYAKLPIRVQWSLPNQAVNVDSHGSSPICEPNSVQNTDPLAASANLSIVHAKEQLRYESVSGSQLLQNEGLHRFQKCVRECYDTDAIGPRSWSATDPPPVKRVKAIYGVNLPTEVGAVYKRPSSILQEPDKVQKLHELDLDAKVSSGYYQIQDGVILETKDTPQLILRGTDAAGSDKTESVCVSGDGTVPYWSLQYCRTWQGACDVSIDELNGAEHREILADPRFHRILVDYVTNN